MLPKRLLFRFRFPCRQTSTLWSAKGGVLDESFQIPDMNVLENDSEQAALPLDFRMAWNTEGIAFSLRVMGKKQRPWCRALHPEESDGLQICLDTRDIHDVHRATRFCHRLVFLPAVAGQPPSLPQVFWLPIHRAKGHPNPINLDQIKMKTSFSPDGYQLDAMIPGKTLTGFEPLEHPGLGFHYVVTDRELGDRYFLVEPPFPHDNDPSLWGSLELTT